MSIHPSLKSSDKTKKQRSVLKRAERLKTMMEKGNWKEGDSIFGLPKIKTIRIKIKKEKAEKAEVAATAEGAAAAPAEAKEQPAAKPAAGAKTSEKK
jgi:small basic protein (TIGR04137 family)